MHHSSTGFDVSLMSKSKIVLTCITHKNNMNETQL